MKFIVVILVLGLVCLTVRNKIYVFVYKLIINNVFLGSNKCWLCQNGHEMFESI
jgi:hypothetical protein